jgi:hypothetical protein
MLKLKKQLLAVTLLLAIGPMTSKSAIALETDKVAHFGTSFILTIVAYGTLKAIGIRSPSPSLGVAMAAAFTAGMYKEFMDTTPDPHDIIANGLGVGAAAGSIILFNF